MSKHSKRLGGRCPNPVCFKYFRTPRQLQSHIGAKPDCRLFLSQMCQQMSLDKLAPCEPSKLDCAVAQQHIVPVQPPPTFPIDAQTDPLLQMDNSPSLPSGNVLPDFEHCAFAMLDDNEDDNFILNEDTCVFTNARRAEIILLKLLTELEAPLWAFQTIMDWALDAYQTGYNFLPNQKSYKSQISSPATPPTIPF